MIPAAGAVAVGAEPRHRNAGEGRDYAAAFQRYANDTIHSPLLLHGDALTVLKALPKESIDCVMTSPPYWRKREYANGGIGIETDHRDYVRNLTTICAELKRVLKPSTAPSFRRPAFRVSATSVRYSYLPR